MKAQALATEYEDLVGKMRREFAQLGDYNLSAIEDEYQQAMRSVQALADRLRMF